MNIGVYTFSQISVFHFLWTYIQEWNCYIIMQFYFQLFEEPPSIFSIVVVPVVHSHQQWTNVPFSPNSCLHLLFLIFFEDGHSDRCEVIFYCDFDIRVPDNYLWSHKRLNSQSNLEEKKKQSCKYHASGFQIILLIQSYSNQNSMATAQSQTYRSMDPIIQK